MQRKPAPPLRLALAAALLACAAPSAAQQARLPGGLVAGSEVEEYLRFLQTTGEVAPGPWSLRGFGRAEADGLLPPPSGHPWAGHPALRHDSSGVVVEALPARTRAWYNSAFPFAANDGAVWAGRGATAAVEAGVAVRAGPLSLALRPVAFAAENRAFDVRGNGKDGERAYADGLRPDVIDLPQRFGPDPYARVDPGESYLRLDAGPVAAGISTATQVWGPGSEYPILLSSAGPGFPHVFVGTSRPADLWVARVHGRVVYGRLDQSAYSPVRDGSARRRFMSGVVGVVQPRGMPGLELGGGRFFHTPWPEDGLSAASFRTPFQGLLKRSLDLDPEGNPGDDRSNQLATFFFRWATTRAGAEVYGEYFREDHNFDLRDLLLEPDHSAAYMLGIRRAWRPSPERMVTLRAEAMNARLSHLARVRTQSPKMIHTGTLQGHTQLGQPLGGRAVYGGAGTIVALDLYHPGGRWSASWTREQRGAPDQTNPEGDVWVADALGAESLFLAGRVGIRAGVTGALERNRYLETGRDEFNLNAQLGLEWTP